MAADVGLLAKQLGATNEQRIVEHPRSKRDPCSARPQSAACMKYDSRPTMMTAFPGVCGLRRILSGRTNERTNEMGEFTGLTYILYDLRVLPRVSAWAVFIILLAAFSLHRSLHGSAYHERKLVFYNT